MSLTSAAWVPWEVALVKTTLMSLRLGLSGGGADEHAQLFIWQY